MEVTMSRFGKILSICIIIIFYFTIQSLLPHKPYQGSILDPVQTNLFNPRTVIVQGESGDVELSILAEYSLKGVIKSKKKYRDFPSQVSKYDYAIAWGDLNKQEIAEHISYSQSGRWYYYRYAQDIPVSREYIAGHSANVHLIAADHDVLKKISQAAKNDYVWLKGYLVNVNFKDDLWQTSLTRDDTGNGACEIMYVTDLAVIDQP